MKLQSKVLRKKKDLCFSSFSQNRKSASSLLIHHPVHHQCFRHNMCGADVETKSTPTYHYDLNKYLYGSTLEVAQDISLSYSYRQLHCNLENEL